MDYLTVKNDKRTSRWQCEIFVKESALANQKNPLVKSHTLAPIWPRMVL